MTDSPNLPPKSSHVRKKPSPPPLSFFVLFFFSYEQNKLIKIVLLLYIINLQNDTHFFHITDKNDTYFFHTTGHIQWCTYLLVSGHLHLHLSLNCGGDWLTKDDFTTSFFLFFLCSPLPSRTWLPWCCPPTSSSVCLFYFPLSLCPARWSAEHYRGEACCGLFERPAPPKESWARTSRAKRQRGETCSTWAGILEVVCYFQSH